MSDILARIRVKETHGIRRFLYPLAAEVMLPRTLDYAALGIATRDNDIDMERLCLVSEEGVSVPTHVTHMDNERFRVDFAVSLAPGATEEYHLKSGVPQMVNDPLHITKSDNGQLLHNRQERFGISLLKGSPIDKVTYNGVDFLRYGLTLTRKREPSREQSGVTRHSQFVSSHFSTTLAAYSQETISFADSAYVVKDLARTRVEITACKSWATVTHMQMMAMSGDEFVFALPLAATSSTLTCDFGIGGYVFGKLQAGVADEIAWQTQFTNDGMARWTVATAGRVDYIGEATATEFVPQRWFHLIDSDKALAVAVTGLPKKCAEMTVTLRINGDVIVAFKLGEVADSTPAQFGVCYHFLNDVPAIAAATNPQSILLPPTVEVLGA